MAQFRNLALNGSGCPLCERPFQGDEKAHTVGLIDAQLKDLPGQVRMLCVILYHVN